MNKRYKIIALTGPAGSGKDTVLQAFFNWTENKQFHKIIRSTTRPRREKEHNGENYWFYTKEQYEALLKDNYMLENNVFNDWYYGINYEDLDINKINIGEFNPHSLMDIYNLPNIDLTIIYLQVSDKERLIRQLSREENPNIDEIIRRYHADKKDFKLLSQNIEYLTAKNETPHQVRDLIEFIETEYWDSID